MKNKTTDQIINEKVMRDFKRNQKRTPEQRQRRLDKANKELLKAFGVQ